MGCSKDWRNDGRKGLAESWAQRGVCAVSVLVLGLRVDMKRALSLQKSGSRMPRCLSFVLGRKTKHYLTIHHFSEKKNWYPNKTSSLNHWSFRIYSWNRQKPPLLSPLPPTHSRSKQILYPGPAFRSHKCIIFSCSKQIPEASRHCYHV